MKRLIKNSGAILCALVFVFSLNGSNQDTYRELLGIPDGYSAAAILLIGHEDTSVDKSADGYTGATTRNPERYAVLDKGRI